MGKLLAALIIGGGLAVAALTPSPASAATVIVTFTGTVSSIYNPPAPFEGVQLGDKWTSVYTFDTDLGGLNTGSGFNTFYGGTAYSLTSPLISATLTIGSTTLTVPAGLNDELFDTNSASKSSVDTGAESATGTLLTSLGNEIIANNGDLPKDPVSLTYNVMPGDYTLARYVVEDPGANYLADVEATLTSVTFDVSSAVPEPSSWVMLLAGFGALGCGLRASRARRQAATI